MFMNTSYDKFEVAVSNSSDCTVVQYVFLYFLYSVMMA